MAEEVRCPECGATCRVVRTSEAQHCPGCGFSLNTFLARRETVDFDAEALAADSETRMDAASVRLKWDGLIAPDTKPEATVKGQPSGTAAGSHLLVKPRALRGPGRPGIAAPDYELLEVIGEGGMGVVYAARQAAVDRTVALKILRPESAGDARMHDALLTEAGVLGTLEHPNIIPVHDLGSNEDGVLFYAMKHIKGTRWSDVIDAKTQAEHLDILLRVADAVAFAHSKGIIHRDIKPGNVMLGEYGEVQLIDWGLAAVVQPGAGIGNAPIGGTPAYMAPEMARGDGSEIGFHSDVYLLGAVLYRILARAMPHGGQTALESLTAASNNILASAGMRGELVEVASKAMAFLPKHRHASVKDFQAAIRSYLEHAESIRLCDGAAERLAQAEETGDYQDYAHALARFQEALTLWEGNKRAAEGVRRTQLAHGRFALSKGDLALAERMLIRDDPEHAKVIVELVLAKQEQKERQRRLDQAVRDGYFYAVRLALQRIEEGNVNSADKLLEECPPQLRNWEWGLAKPLGHQELATFGVVFHPKWHTRQVR